METLLAFVEPKSEMINIILKSLDEPTESIRCSVCGRKLLSKDEIGAIYPYKSALICCKKIECILGCTDKLLEDDFIK
jgi:hypothetical protein